MFIAKNNNLIILVKETRDELEQALQFMVYTSIEETDIEYTMYNGKYLTPDEIEAKEREHINNLTLSKEKFLLAIYNLTSTTPEDIEAMVGSMEDVSIYFKYSNEYKRGDSLICALCSLLSISTEDMDKIFLENNQEV